MMPRVEECAHSFLCFNVHLPAEILSGLDVEAGFFFLHAVVSVDSGENSPKKSF